MTKITCWLNFLCFWGSAFSFLYCAKTSFWLCTEDKMWLFEKEKHITILTSHDSLVAGRTIATRQAKQTWRQSSIVHRYPLLVTSGATDGHREEAQRDTRELRFRRGARLAWEHRASLGQDTKYSWFLAFSKGRKMRTRNSLCCSLARFSDFLDSLGFFSPVLPSPPKLLETPKLFSY